jgi:diacylglycerol O-acyltransferase 1
VLTAGCLYLGCGVQRILKLAVPNLMVWLLGFYAFFHLWLNILAELLRFGDRLFYKDWWNCTTVVRSRPRPTRASQPTATDPRGRTVQGTFWKTWNLGVHYWFVQHVYRPMRARGYSRTAALLVIFFVSAVFHELIVSVAFSTVSFFAFGGMLLQVAAVLVSEPMRGKQVGNVFFWVTIMLGQPLIVLFYFVDYVTQRAVPA